MKFFVLRSEPNDLSSISLKKADDTVVPPFESWALITGAQVVFANVKMQALLKGQYMYGSYDTKAVYAYTYDEMHAILTEYLGPCDRERVAIARSKKSLKPANFAYGHAFVKSSQLLGIVAYMGVKFLGLMLIIPFLIKLITRPK